MVAALVIVHPARTPREQQQRRLLATEATERRQATARALGAVRAPATRVGPFGSAAAHLHLFVRRLPCKGSLLRAGRVPEIKRTTSSSSRGPLIAMWCTPKLAGWTAQPAEPRGSKCHRTRVPLHGSGRTAAQPRPKGQGATYAPARLEAGRLGNVGSASCCATGEQEDLRRQPEASQQIRIFALAKHATGAMPAAKHIGPGAADHAVETAGHWASRGGDHG